MLILIACHKEVDDFSLLSYQSTAGDIYVVPPNHVLTCSTVIVGEFLAIDEGAFVQNTFPEALTKKIHVVTNNWFLMKATVKNAHCYCRAWIFIQISSWIGVRDGPRINLWPNLKPKVEEAQLVVSKLKSSMDSCKLIVKNNCSCSWFCIVQLLGNPALIVGPLYEDWRCKLIMHIVCFHVIRNDLTSLFQIPSIYGGPFEWKLINDIK